jgi:hypothetical protein
MAAIIRTRAMTTPGAGPSSDTAASRALLGSDGRPETAAPKNGMKNIFTSR